jgi:hypothetical protein
MKQKAKKVERRQRETANCSSPTAEFYSGATKITLSGANFQRACGM